MRPSRREFLNWVSASGIALSLARLGAAEAASLPPRASLPGRANWNPAASADPRRDRLSAMPLADTHFTNSRREGRIFLPVGRRCHPHIEAAIVNAHGGLTTDAN